MEPRRTLQRLRHRLRVEAHARRPARRSALAVTGIVNSVADYVLDELREPWRYEVLRDGSVERRDPPGTLDAEVHPTLRALARHEHPPAFRVTLPGAGLAGPEPLVLTEDLRALLQSAYDREQLDRSRTLRRRLPAARRIRGHCAALVTPWEDNHFHFMLDALPRAALLPDDGEPVLVSDRLTTSQLWGLDRVGIPTERTRTFDHRYTVADELVWPSLVGRTGNPPPWAVRWLRERLARGPGTRKRVYVSRADAFARRVANEPELTAALRDLGFEVIRPALLPLAEQLTAFGEAEVICGPHGAGLANLVAAAPGTTVIELMDPRYVNGCYYALSGALGHRYWYLLGRAAQGDDLYVDPSAACATVEAATAVRSATRG